MTSEEYKDAIEKDPEFEARIASALEIDVPALKMPELPDIDTGNVTTLPRRRFAAPQWLAVAATVATVAVLGFFTLGDDHTYDSLADEILAHLDHEPWALEVTDIPVSDRRLNQIVPANVATMNHDAGLITYAESCEINGNVVPHLVIQGQYGPITIILMPDEKIDGAQSLMGESVNGVILPVGDGSIAIIGEEGENLERVEQNLRDSVRWSTT